VVFPCPAFFSPLCFSVTETSLIYIKRIYKSTSALDVYPGLLLRVKISARVSSCTSSCAVIIADSTISQCCNVHQISSRSALGALGTTSSTSVAILVAHHGGILLTPKCICRSLKTLAACKSMTTRTPRAPLLTSGSIIREAGAQP